MVMRLSAPHSVLALREKLCGFESVFDSAPVGLCVLDLDYRYVTVNDCFARMYNVPKSDFVGRSVEQVLPGPASQIMSHLRQVVASNGIVEREIALQNPSSTSTSVFEEMIFLRTAQPLRDEDGVICGISVALLDITQRKRSAAALEESEENLRYTVELTPHIPWTADATGELIFISPRWNTITGTKPGPVYLKQWAEVLHPDDLTSTAAIWAHSVASGDPYDAEYRIRSADGGWRWVRARAFPRSTSDGKIIRWYGTVEDVHERKSIAMQLEAANEELSRRAEEDHLTGLPNRRRFDAALMHEIDRARRTKLPLALVLLDIDYFKRYNDIAGHLAGDECLKLVAWAIARVLRRPADLAARYGGEEFVMLLPETSPEGAAVIANRALKAVQRLQIAHPDLRVGQVTISLGLAMLEAAEISESETTSTRLIAAADVALYEAKARGRNQLVVAEHT